MKIKTKDLAFTTIFAAVYAALVIIFLPISFLPQQFRVAGILRLGIARKWILALGYGIGVVVGNVFGQFVGPWGLVFMPVMSIVAGFAGYLVAKPFKNNYIAGAVIATITSLSLSFMFSQLGFGPMIVTWPALFIGEQAVCLIGSFIFKLIETRFRWWQT